MRRINKYRIETLTSDLNKCKEELKKMENIPYIEGNHRSVFDLLDRIEDCEIDIKVIKFGWRSPRFIRETW